MKFNWSDMVNFIGICDIEEVPIYMVYLQIFILNEIFKNRSVIIN